MSFVNGIHYAYNPGNEINFEGPITPIGVYVARVSQEVSRYPISLAPPRRAGAGAAFHFRLHAGTDNNQFRSTYGGMQ